MKVVAVRTVDGAPGRLNLTYDDGVSTVADVTSCLAGPIFEPIKRDIGLFAEVQVDLEFGSVFWLNGADIAPETLVILQEERTGDTP